MSTAVESFASTDASRRYAQHVNPQWVRLLDVLQMNVRYERCRGAELFTSDGRRILDFSRDTACTMWGITIRK
jgi:hypothetical protein